MDFSEAFHLLLAGKKVRREDWNRPRWIFKATATSGGVSVPGVWMEMKNGLIGAYSPSQCDLLSADWYPVSESGNDGQIK